MHEVDASGHNGCMSTQSLTSTVTAQHATELRANRDRTDDDIQADYLRRISSHDLAAERAKATGTRRTWERRAAEDAVGSVINRYFEDSGSFSFGEYGQIGGVNGAIADLEGVTITVSINDLVATATLTTPAAG